MKHALVGRKKSAKIQLIYNCNNKTVHSNCNTTISLRRALESIIFSFLRLYKIFKENFETYFNDLYLARRTC